MKLLWSLSLLSLASAGPCSCGDDPADQGFVSDAFCASTNCVVLGRRLENGDEPSVARREQATGCLLTKPRGTQGNFYIWMQPEFYDRDCPEVCCREGDRQERGECLIEANICGFKENEEPLYSVCAEDDEGNTFDDCLGGNEVSALAVGDTYGNEDYTITKCGCCNEDKKKCTRNPVCTPNDQGFATCDRKNGKPGLQFCRERKKNGKKKTVCKDARYKKNGFLLECGAC